MVGSRGMTAEPPDNARKIRRTREPPANVIWFLCSFEPSFRDLMAYHLENGADAFTWCVWANCKKGTIIEYQDSCA